MKKILVVVDMQKDFIDGSLGTKEAAGIVERAAEGRALWKGRRKKSNGLTAQSL